MDAVIKAPLSERINFRMILFALVVLVLVGYPVYLYLDSVISGGIKVHADGYTEVDLKAMSTFAFDQNNGTMLDVPEKWRQQDGKKVVLYGEMWVPYSTGDKLTSFELVYSIAKCCFSGPPQIQHFVQAKPADPNKKIPYYSGLVKVRGTLHVDVKKAEGKVVSVYQLDVESVEPA